jgi:hypothetical protein
MIASLDADTPHDFVVGTGVSRSIKDLVITAGAVIGMNAEEVVLDALRESWSDSFARAEGVPRYPSGAPTLRACTSVNHAFCLAANDQFDEYWELVEKM